METATENFDIYHFVIFDSYYQSFKSRRETGH